jgi:putative ABC transport system permease protein
MHADHGHGEGDDHAHGANDDHEEHAHEGHNHSDPDHVHDHNGETQNPALHEHKESDDAHEEPESTPALAQSEPNHAEHGHDHAAAEHHDHDHGGHGHEGHDHPIHNAPPNPKVLPPISKEGKEVTAYLVQYKKDGQGNTSLRATVEAPMIIDDNSSSMGYAKPAIELQRLLEMTGVGMDFLRALALIIILISAFSMFISLYSSLKERRYEMALMRVQGARPRQLFAMIILEGLLVALVGFLIGIVISHLGMEIMAAQLEDTYKYTFTGMVFLLEEWLLLLGTLLVGFLAAVLPAIQAYRVDISATLSEG